MNKLFLAFIAVSCLAISSANALVIQKAKSALSLRNTMSASGNAPETKVVNQSSIYRLHLMTADVASASMKVHDEIEISLPETANHRWKYSCGNNFSVSNDVSDGSTRKITFKLNSKASDEEIIYFDKRDEISGEVVKNKSATIRIR